MQLLNKYYIFTLSLLLFSCNKYVPDINYPSKETYNYFLKDIIYLNSFRNEIVICTNNGSRFEPNTPDKQSIAKSSLIVLNSNGELSIKNKPHKFRNKFLYDILEQNNDLFIAFDTIKSDKLLSNNLFISKYFPNSSLQLVRHINIDSMINNKLNSFYLSIDLNKKNSCIATIYGIDSSYKILGFNLYNDSISYKEYFSKNSRFNLIIPKYLSNNRIFFFGSFFDNSSQKIFVLKKSDTSFEDDTSFSNKLEFCSIARAASLIENDSSIYIGGSFLNTADYTLPQCFLRITNIGFFHHDFKSKEARFELIDDEYPEFKKSSIYCMQAINDSQIIVGGYFNYYNGKKCSNSLAVISKNGELDKSLNFQLPEFSIIHHIYAPNQDTIYLGGYELNPYFPSLPILRIVKTKNIIDILDLTGLTFQFIICLMLLCIFVILICITPKDILLKLIMFRLHRTKLIKRINNLSNT